MKEHIVTTYDEDLNSLKSNLTKMGLNVEKQIYNAVDLTKIINISKAKEVVENDKDIDALEKKIRGFATIRCPKDSLLQMILGRLLFLLKYQVY